MIPEWSTYQVPSRLHIQRAIAGSHRRRGAVEVIIFNNPCCETQLCYIPPQNLVDYRMAYWPTCASVLRWSTHRGSFAAPYSKFRCLTLTNSLWKFNQFRPIGEKIYKHISYKDVLHRYHRPSARESLTDISAQLHIQRAVISTHCHRHAPRTRWVGFVEVRSRHFVFFATRVTNKKLPFGNLKHDYYLSRVTTIWAAGLPKFRCTIKACSLCWTWENSRNPSTSALLPKKPSKSLKTFWRSQTRRGIYCESTKAILPVRLS